MGTILKFQNASGGKEQSAFRERRTKAGPSAEVILFPGVRIERNSNEQKRTKELDVCQQSDTPERSQGR